MVEAIPLEEAEMMFARASKACACLDSDGDLAHDVLRLLRERKSLQLQLLRAQSDCDGEACLFQRQ